MPPPPKPSIPQWRQKRARLAMEIADIDEMQQFQSTPEAEDVPDLKHYWAKRLNSPHWSRQASMALTIHSFLAMSSEVERVSSSSKLLMSDHCNCLLDAVISAVECLQCWERAGFIKMTVIRQVKDSQVVLEKRKE